MNKTADIIAAGDALNTAISTAAGAVKLVAKAQQDLFEAVNALMEQNYALAEELEKVKAELEVFRKREAALEKKAETVASKE